MHSKVLICGAGSIGIYLGTLLHSKGDAVTLFGRRKLGEIKEEIFIGSKKYALPRKIFRLPNRETYDFIFVTTKLYDLGNMIKLIKKHKLKSKVFVSIQNGLIDNAKYEKVLKTKIVPVSVFAGYQLSGNKLIANPTPIGWKTDSSPEGKLASALVSSVGIKCSSERNLDSVRAEKTIVNCCLNALSAIESKPFSHLFKGKATRERINKLFQECYDILSKDHQLDNPDKIMKRMYENWSDVNHYSSTYQDVVSGRKTEIEFFNKYLVKIGRKEGLKTDENQSILRDFDNVIKSVVTRK